MSGAHGLTRPDDDTAEVLTEAQRLAARALYTVLTCEKVYWLDERFLQQVLLQGLKRLPGLGADLFGGAEETRWDNSALAWADLLGWDREIDPVERRVNVTHLIEVKVHGGRMAPGQLDRYAATSATAHCVVFAPETWLRTKGFLADSHRDKRAALNEAVTSLARWVPVSYEEVAAWLEGLLGPEDLAPDATTDLIVAYGRAEPPVAPAADSSAAEDVVEVGGHA